MTKEEKYIKLVNNNLTKELSKTDLYYFKITNRYCWIDDKYEILLTYKIKSQQIIYYGWGNRFKSSLCLEDNEFEILMRRYIKGKFGGDVGSINYENIEYGDYVVRKTIIQYGEKIYDQRGKI